MSLVVIDEDVADDIGRIHAHLIKHEVPDPDLRIDQIFRAIDVPLDNPWLGRPVERGYRELVIGRDSRGYLALYDYADEIDTVFVLAVRAQKEAGYARG